MLHTLTREKKNIPGPAVMLFDLKCQLNDVWLWAYPAHPFSFPAIVQQTPSFRH